MCSFQIIEPSPLHDIVRPFGPSPPLGHAINLRKRLIGPSDHRPLWGNAVKLSKILIAHASNSVCFFHALSLPVNNKIKKLVK